MHRHCLVTDGTFETSDDGAPKFRSAPAPTDADLVSPEQLIAKLIALVPALVIVSLPAGTATGYTSPTDASPPVGLASLSWTHPMAIETTRQTVR